MPVWLQNGAIKKSAGGILLCEDCPCLDLHDCGGTLYARCWEITVAGITNGTCVGTNCTILNGTHILIVTGNCCIYSTGTLGNFSGCPGGSVGSGPIFWGMNLCSGTLDASVTTIRYSIVGTVDPVGTNVFSFTSKLAGCNNPPSTITAVPVACP